MTPATMQPYREAGATKLAAEAPGVHSIAIICGAGSFPGAVADAITRRGRRPVMFALKGWADPKIVERYVHHWVAFGQVGRFPSRTFQRDVWSQSDGHFDIHQYYRTTGQAGSVRISS